MKNVLFALVALVALITSQAQAADTALGCREELIPSVSEDPRPNRQTVCEASVEVDGKSARLLFVDFAGGFVPELTFLQVESKGFLTSSLSQGRRSFRALPASFLASGPTLRVNQAFKSFLKQNSIPIRNFVAQARNSATALTVERDLVAAGPHSFHVPEQKAPFRIYWWPMSGAPIADGPLQKFDQYLTNTGGTPGAAAWERSQHANGGTNWYGHCNGWAAGSVLYAEPTQTRRAGNLLFEVRDQKALISEASFCVSYLFFGRRYYGSDDEASDIKPALFHRTLVHFLRDEQKAVALDIKPLEEVYNHVISGVDMSIMPTEEGAVRVTAAVRLHTYDESDGNQVGVAPSETRVYEYSLPVKNGVIQGDGTWLSENPDFLWVPLAPKDCAGRENPFLRSATVQKILRLPFGE